MKHAKSNINILKKSRVINQIKSNNFKKSSTNQINNNIESNNNKNRKFLLRLLEKNNTKKTINTSKIFYVGSNGSPNKLYSINKSSINKNLYNGTSKTLRNGGFYRGVHGNINIRLNLNSEIINNNYIRSKGESQKYYVTKIDMNEKLKEKEKQITKLQKNLLESQKLLNKLQKDKQKEISITYNSFKKVDEFNNSKNIRYTISNFFIPNYEKNIKILKTNLCIRNSKKKTKNKIRNKKNSKYINGNNSLSEFFNFPSILKFNYIKNRNNERNIIKYKNINFNPNNSGNKKGISIQSNYLRCFSSSPNRFISYCLNKFNSFSKSSKNIFKQKANKKRRLIPNLNTAFKNDESFFVPRQNSDFFISNFVNSSFVSKCEELKKKAKILLNNYINLSNSLINIKNENELN